MRGKFFGVGVGSGDPELITVKAIKILKNCDCVVIPKAEGKDSTVFNIAKNYISKNCEILEIEFSMVKDLKKREQSRKKAANIISKYLDEGKNIAFITLGDISIYSTCMYVYKILRSYNYDCELIPGVPSFCSVAAKIGESLGEDIESFCVVPSAFNTDKLLEAIKSFDNIVIMKSAKNINEIKKILVDNGFSNVKGIMNCGIENERVFNNIYEFDDNIGYFTTIIAKR